MYANGITKERIDKAIAFHGHWCPGLARGIRVAAWVMDNLGTTVDEEIVCITETDMCAVDAVQALVGCTFGKGNLIYQNKGKVAFSFYRRSDGKQVRLVEKPRPNAEMHLPQDLRKRLIDETDTEMRQQIEAELAMYRQKELDRLLNSPFEELFDIKEPRTSLPPMAQRLPTIICESCGEGVMASRIVEKNGKKLCLDCAQA
jgi:formylmethanofuran dehydrogenase subunit E